MITVSMPLWVWAVCAMSIILGGKEMQQGAIKWARHEPWQMQTSVGAMMTLLPLMTVFIFALDISLGDKP